VSHEDEMKVVQANAERIYTDFAADVARVWEGIPEPQRTQVLDRLVTLLAARHPDLVDLTPQEDDP
jgi:delta 1-pyrroline-5-carboxylate dehydrogenase